MNRCRWQKLIDSGDSHAVVEVGVRGSHMFPISSVIESIAFVMHPCRKNTSGFQAVCLSWPLILILICCTLEYIGELH